MGGIGLARGGRKVSRILRSQGLSIVAIADVQKERREIIKRLADRQYGNSDCVIYDDMSGVLERDDIDSVIIATGDRWHTTASIKAARAGKDIYRRSLADEYHGVSAAYGAIKKHKLFSRRERASKCQF